MDNNKLSINEKELANLYSGNQYDQMCDKFLKILNHFRDNTLINIPDDMGHFINVFVENFMFYLTKEDFSLKRADAERFIFLNPVISNLAAISSLKNTDYWIKKLLRQSRNLLKILILFNSRNTVKLDRKVFFDKVPGLASIWYGIYFATAQGWQSKTVYENMNEHMVFWDDRIVLNSPGVSDGYMISTYINPYKDRVYKNNFNNLVKKNFSNVNIVNNPDNRQIAVVTNRWSPVNPTYKNRYPLLEALKEDYELTLIHVGKKRDDLELSLFKDVKHVSFNRNKLHIGPLERNNFIMVFYPDIGMNIESRFLSNLRIAPIQIMSNSHPVSTFGSEIDYFLTGIDSEEIENVKDYYSERMVLVPGIGVYPAKINYERKNKKKQREEFIINCSWGGHKLNYPLIEALKEILQKSRKKLLFRFLPTLAINFNNVVPFRNDIEEILGRDNMEFFANNPYEKYMEILEEGDISIDSYPFGGLTTIIDNVYLKKPIVAWEGWQFYNKAASVILRKIGLEELVAKNRDEYIEKVLKLINDDEYRTTIINKIGAINTERVFDEFTDKKALKKALDYLIENREELKNSNKREPIIIT